jgi:hypothetical protein
MKARHLLVALCLGAVLGLLVAGCGQGETEGIANAARDAGEADHLRLPAGDEFHPDLPPLDPGDLTPLPLAGAEAGRRAKSAGRQLTEGSDVETEQQKHLACFVTEKALDGETPQSPEQLEEEVAKYLGEELADQIEETKYISASEDLVVAAEEVETEGGISADTALNAVCDT